MDKIIQANINVHTKLVQDGNYQLSPHKLDENKKKIKRILRKKIKRNNILHLDVGCGDGFIFDCTPKTWSSYGLDITDAMINECKKNHPSIVVKKGVAEKIPFPNSHFDFVSCYSFLDHLKDTSLFYKEVYRILKPGGYFFFGLNPNSHFFNSIQLIYHVSNKKNKKFSPEDEFKKAFHNAEYYRKFGIKEIDLELCEPGRSRSNGLNPFTEIMILENFFKKPIEIKFNWIVNQNRLEKNFIKSIYDALPFSSSLFKYFDIYGQK